MYRNTYVKVNLNDIQNNIQNIIKNNNYKYYIGVVKGNAYGHGEYIIKELIENKINYLAVSSLEEALSIRRKHKNIPILCMQPINIKYIKIAKENNITITIHDYEYYQQIQEINIKAHIKLDTGMNRLGINKKDQLEKIIKEKKLFIEGIYSHFASSGLDDKLWDTQLENFKYLTKDIDLNQIPIIHFGRSQTLINHEKIDFCNGIRIGLLMYGIDPTPKFPNTIKWKLKKIKAKIRIKRLKISKTNEKCNIDLKPAFSLHSEIIQIKEVKKNSFVGYGMGFFSKENIRIAVVPIGYADGFSRKNTNRNVWINKKPYKIIGEVGMGMIQIKIDNDIKINDEVILIDSNKLKEVSRHLRTTTYETITQISKTVPRVYTKNNQIEYIEE